MKSRNIRRDTDSECEYIRVLNMDKLEIKREASGPVMTPFIKIVVGTTYPNDNGGVDDDGTEYIEEVYNELKDSIQVPCIIHSSLIDVELVG